ncbi:MAG: response regulator [Nostoc sp. DedSLP01]|nr:hybrid sensor histidine kinase/response regulator [Nostoc sp. DedSLP01]
MRVSADNLNRIMGLAGESLIEANWLQPFADSMMSLKSRMLDISRSLEQLQESLDQNLYEQEGKEYLVQARQQKQECLDYIGDRLNELELYVRRTASLSDRLYREVINSHMRPFEDGLQGFPRMIRDLARKLNKQVKLEIIGKSIPVDRDILTKLEAPLTHILRNAVDHGIELPEERIASGKSSEGTIRLEAFHRGGMLAITISDDGRGINREQLRQKIISKNLATLDMVAQLSDVELMEFLFLPGFSTVKQVTEISGRGVGLDIAKSMALEVGGTVRATSQAAKGTSFHFQLPLTLSVVRTLLVEISEKPYAIPLARIDQIVNLERSEITDVENRQYFTMNKQNIGLIAANQVLELPAASRQNTTVSIVVISDQNSTYGLVVDKFLGERDLVVRPLDPRLGKVPDISATALLGDGSPILIIDVSDMVRSMDTILKVGNLSKVMMPDELESITQRRKILVVDDSITVREMERKLLENHGYQVDTAVNGVEGWNAVRTNEYDLVISDIDMPRMNGIELVKQIKNSPRLNSLPIIIISYRDREEDKIQGLEAGADYYLTKSSFHDDSLVNAVIDLIGN